MPKNPHRPVASNDEEQRTALGEELKAQACRAIDALLAKDEAQADEAYGHLLRKAQDFIERKRKMEGSKTDTRDLVMEQVFTRLRQGMRQFVQSDDARQPQRAAEWTMASLYSMATLTELARAFDQALLQASHGSQDFNFASRTDFLSLEEVLQMLAAGKHKGCLSLEKADNRLDVYMQDGRIVHLDPHHISRRVLPSADPLKQRELLAAAVERAEAERSKSGRPIVLALADAGCFRPEELRDMLRLFGREALYEFLMEDAPVVFYYKRQERLPDFAVEHDLRLGVTSALLEGSKRQDDWRIMRRMFPDPDAPLEACEGMYARMGDLALDVLEIKLLSQIGAAVSPRKLAPILGLPLFDVYALIVRLAREGILVGAAMEQPVGGDKLTVEESLREAFAALDSNDDRRVRQNALDAALGGEDRGEEQRQLKRHKSAAASMLDSLFDDGGKPAQKADRPAGDDQDFLSILKRSRPDPG